MGRRPQFQGLTFLEAARRTLGLSIPELAAAVLIAPQHLRSLELLRDRPSGWLVVRLSEALDLPEEVLFDAQEVEVPGPSSQSGELARARGAERR